MKWWDIWCVVFALMQFKWLAIYEQLFGIRIQEDFTSQRTVRSIFTKGVLFYLYKNRLACQHKSNCLARRNKNNFVQLDKDNQIDFFFLLQQAPSQQQPLQQLTSVGSNRTLFIGLQMARVVPCFILFGWSVKFSRRTGAVSASRSTSVLPTSRPSSGLGCKVSQGLPRSYSLVCSATSYCLWHWGQINSAIQHHFATSWLSLILSRVSSSSRASMNWSLYLVSPW